MTKEVSPCLPGNRIKLLKDGREGENLLFISLWSGSDFNSVNTALGLVVCGWDWPIDWKISMCPWLSLSVTCCQTAHSGAGAWTWLSCLDAALSPCVSEARAAQAFSTALLQCLDPLNAGDRMCPQTNLPPHSSHPTPTRRFPLPSLIWESGLLPGNRKYSSSGATRKFALEQ